jgi:signal transduction histidine kinase
MNFRSRLLMAFAAATVLPLVVLALGVRRQLSGRMHAQYERRVQGLIQVAAEDVDNELVTIASQLRALSQALAQEDRFRLAAVLGVREERRYLIDWAERAMRLSGLSMLQLQDEQGRILSSGHFRNEFDRLEPELPRLLDAAGGRATLVRTRAPDGPFLALARIDSVRVGGRRFTLVGGRAVDSAYLHRFAREGGLEVSLVTRDSAWTPPVDRVTATLPLAWADTRAASAPLDTARLVITYPLGELAALRGDLDRWSAIVLAAGVTLGLALATWLATRMSRPLAELAQATARVELDGPAITFATGRDDEIGALARRLGTMAIRLRSSATKLREAERRATVGELARQVNHDVKNGLIPIRNVIRHLSEVQSRPDELASVFADRRATLESSITYLDTLARNYARLTPRSPHARLDVNAIATEVGTSASAGELVTVRQRLAPSLPAVAGDPVALRRILENLVRNGVESLDGKGGDVLIETSQTDDGRVRIAVTDTGRGMSDQELASAFDDFFTTKPSGTGLGLSVVRRLTSDLGGTLRVESAPGRGTRFTIDLAPHDRSAPPSGTR